MAKQWKVRIAGQPRKESDLGLLVQAVVPRLVADRLGDEVVCELIEARRAGAKLRELVERYEGSETA